MKTTPYEITEWPEKLYLHVRKLLRLWELESAL